MLSTHGQHNIVQVIFLKKVCLLGQYSTGNFLVQCWLRHIKTTLCIYGYFPAKRWLWYVVSANTTPVIFLCNVVSDVLGQHWLDCVLWIVQVIVLCNVGRSRPRQHCAGYFPARTCLCTQGQYCTRTNAFGQQWVYNIPIQLVPTS